MAAGEALGGLGEGGVGLDAEDLYGGARGPGNEFGVERGDRVEKAWSC